MELLPPKPPTTVGGDKKGVAKASANTAKGQVHDDDLPEFSLPPIEKIENEINHPTLDEKVTVDSRSEKRPGFFSKLFKKKDVVPATSPIYDKKNEEEELETLKQSLGMTNPSRKIALSDIEKTPDYVPKTAWDSQLVDISSYRKNANYSKSVDEEKKSESNAIKDLKKIETKSALKENFVEKNLVQKNTKQERPKNTSKNIDVKEGKDKIKEKFNAKESFVKKIPIKSNALEEKIDYTKEIKKLPQKDSKQKEIKPLVAKKITEIKQKNQVIKKEIKHPSDIKENWDAQSTELLETAIKNQRVAKQVQDKLKKLFNNYNQKLSKLVKDKKKLISSDMSKLDIKVKDLQKKQINLSQREQKLNEFNKSLEQRKREIDALSMNTDALKKTKGQLEADIEKYKRILSTMRADMLNAKKSYDYEKKEFAVRRHDLQLEQRRFEDMCAREKQRANEELVKLDDKLQEKQALLDETLKKTQLALSKLKNKELALEAKEKKVNDLLEQEKKMLSMLKGNVKTTISHDTELDVKKKIIEKPVLVVEKNDELAIFIDDEDAIVQKIEDCKDLVKEENFEDAKMLYNEIREDFKKASIDEDRKAEVKHQIRELYDEIAIGIIAPKD